MAEQGFTPPTSEWYRPSAEMVAQSNVPDYEAVYDQAAPRPGGLLGGARRDA